MTPFLPPAALDKENRSMKGRLILGLLCGLVPIIAVNNAAAHQSGCHRWHSCPSDTGSYICGDLGYTNFCPGTSLLAPKPKPESPELLAPLAVQSVTVSLISCYDGDTCTFTGPKGEPVKVRLLGIDAPEIKGACEAERDKAALAKNILTRMLTQASQIEMASWGEKDRYGRLLGIIRADGVDVAGALILLGLGRPYQGGKRQPWC